MDEALFKQWASAHIRSTGADPERLAELLAANRETICARWHATYEELCECTERLIERARVPKFPDGHTNALKLELDNLRAERDRARKMQGTRSLGDHPKGCDCLHCTKGKHSPAMKAALARLRATVKERSNNRRNDHGSVEDRPAAAATEHREAPGR